MTNERPDASKTAWVFPLLLLVAIAIVVVFWKNKAALEKETTTANQPLAGTQDVKTVEPVAVQPGAAPPLPKPPPPAAPGSTVSQLVSRLNDSAVPVKERRAAARALAAIGSDDAIAALKTALHEAVPYIKAAFGEGLGENPHPEAIELLRNLLNDSDDAAARGAARGLATRGDKAAVNLLAAVLNNAQWSESVRTEAALALGDIPQPTAFTALAQALSQSQDEIITEYILEGLGRRAFAETQEVFRNYLNSPGVSADLRVAALEGLAGAQGDVAPFLLKYAGDPDPEVRAAAAWALGATEERGNLGNELLLLLRQEKDSEVRTHLYSALENQSAVDVQAALALVQGETQLAARLAGLNFLATSLLSSPPAELLNYFNQTAVPELRNVALGDGSVQDRLASVLALGRAKTPETLAALRTIASQSADRKIVEAAQTALRLAPPQ